MNKVRKLKKALALALSLALVNSYEIPQKAITAYGAESSIADLELSFDSSVQTVTLSDATTTEIHFAGSNTYNTLKALADVGYSALEVDYTITSYTASGNPGVQPFVVYGNTWKGKWYDLTSTGSGSATLDLGAISTTDTSNIDHFGFQVTNVTGTVSYQITGVRLTGAGTAKSSTSSGSTSADSDVSGVSITVTDGSGANGNYYEKVFGITNNTGSTITGVQILIPVNTASNVQAWGATAVYDSEQGGIIFYYAGSIPNGSTYYSEDVKCGFVASDNYVGTPSVIAINCSAPAGSGVSGYSLDYEITGNNTDLAYSETPYGKHGDLKLATVSGYSQPIIVDEAGNPMILRGASTHGLHWPEMSPFVNKDGFQSLRDEWGINCIRLAIYPKEGGYTEGKQSVLDTLIENGVSYATELGMYVIIDWHVLSYNPWDTESQAETFFEKYASKYADYGNVLFEIGNEPTGCSWYNGSGKDLYTYAKTLTGIIRKYTDALVICGTNNWSQDVQEVASKPLSADGYTNVLYTLHFYAASHYDDLKKKLKTAIEAGTPIFVSEFGTCDASGNGSYDFDNASAWINLLTDNGISFACWSLCNKNESASYISNGSSKTSNWTESDLAPTGYWLINTCRALQDLENATDTSKEEETTTQEETTTEDESSKAAAEEASKKAAEEASRLAEEESLKAAAEEASKKAAEEASRLAEEESSKAAAEEASRLAEEESSKAAEEASSKVAAEEASKKTAEEATTTKKVEEATTVIKQDTVVSNVESQTTSTTATTTATSTSTATTTSVPGVGSVIKYKNVTYVVKANKQLTVKKINKKAKKIVIYDYLTIQGVKYKVTSIEAKAGKNCKKLKSVTIGTNVKTIGKEAFYKCKSLKTVKVNAKGIKKVGKNAFKKINKNAKFKLPKSKLKKYKKLFKLK